MGSWVSGQDGMLVEDSSKHVTRGTRGTEGLLRVLGVLGVLGTLQTFLGPTAEPPTSSRGRQWAKVLQRADGGHSFRTGTRHMCRAWVGVTGVEEIKEGVVVAEMLQRRMYDVEGLNAQVHVP